MGLLEAQFAEQTKLVVQHSAPIAAAKARAFRFANEGIPARAAELLANEFETLLVKIAALESRVDELEKKSSYPAHMKGVERR